MVTSSQSLSVCHVISSVDAKVFLLNYYFACLVLSVSASMSGTGGIVPMDSNKKSSSYSLPSLNAQKKNSNKQDKGKARAPLQDIGQAGLKGSSSVRITNDINERKQWSWLSITDAMSSKRPSVFSKDGRYSQGQCLLTVS
jgi:hypothetical protein